MASDSSKVDEVQPAIHHKRPLFQKPAKAKPVDEAEEGVNFFSRSKDIFTDVVAENRRKRLEKLERKRSKEGAEKASSLVQEEKRRKVSNENHDEDRRRSPSDDELTKNLLVQVGGSSATTPPSAHSVRSLRSSGLASPKKRNRSPGSPSAHSKSNAKTSISRPTTTTSQPVIISLSDVSSDDEPTLLPPTLDAKASKSTISIVDEDGEESEDEMFPELVAAARERNRKKMQEQFRPRQPKDPTIANSENDDVFRTTPPVLDPIVHLLISSTIEGTNPLKIRRRMSQRLKEPRRAWCDKQQVNGRPMTEEAIAEIFLTWRGKRLFDVSTCKSMGLKVNSSGQIRLEGDEGFEGDHVHLEAWTEEAFKQYEMERDEKRRRQHQDPTDDDEPRPEEPQIESKKLRIILKGKGSEPFKLVVKPTTLISTIIGAYRKQMNVSKDKEVSLYCDGDKLDPASAAGDTDLDDMVGIDVHIN